MRARDQIEAIARDTGRTVEQIVNMPLRELVRLIEDTRAIAKATMAFGADRVGRVLLGLSLDEVVVSALCEEPLS